MKFSLNRELLLKPLQHIAAVVEKKQTKPILANVLLVVDENGVSLTGTDSEIELIAFVELETVEAAGKATIPARKLLDIFRSLPAEAVVKFALQQEKMIVTSGRSRFSLSTLPVEEFPNLEDETGATKIHIKQKEIKYLIEKTAFAMAQQDVRFYLNGLLLEVSANRLRAVATDGHRLSVCDHTLEAQNYQDHSVILPRKGVQEMVRLFDDSDNLTTLIVGQNHLRVIFDGFVFTTKLVSAKYPDYNRVLPKIGNDALVGNRELLMQALNRVAILTNEKFRAVRVELTQGLMKIQANNPEQEEAEEEVEIDFNGEPIELGFNVAYLLDALSAIDEPFFKLILSVNHASSIIQALDDKRATYVVMPMRK